MLLHSEQIVHLSSYHFTASTGQNKKPKLLGSTEKTYSSTVTSTYNNSTIIRQNQPINGLQGNKQQYFSTLPFIGDL